MATYTGNYNLKKPATTDPVNIEDLNGNADIIDAALAGKVDKVAGKGLSTLDFTVADRQAISNAYVKPTAGVPKTDLSQDVQTSLDKADNSLQAALDETLTVQGAAADAKATGDAVGELKSAINTKAPVIIDTASGEIASFDDGADGMPLKSLTVNIEPVQAGSGDPSPTNVRPISGWTGANVSRTGKNLLDANNYQAGIAVTTGGITTQTADRYSYYISVKEGEIFTFSAADRGTSTYFWICTYATEPNVAGVEAVSYSDNISGTDRTVTIPNGAKYLCLFFGAGVMVDPQLELGSTATSYEPYQGTTFPITFPTEAGTVYGGTITLNPDRTGTLVVDRASIDMGDMAWTYEAADFFASSSLLRIRKTGIDFICSCYRNGGATPDSQMATAQDKSIYSNSMSGNWISVKDTAYANASDFKAAVTGQTICYALATPIIYQLTPQQLTTLLGTNNIWADTGDVDVTYPADTKLFIQNVNKPIDDDMTADTQIASGKYFIIGNTLYLSTTVIPAGDTIIPGTNCQQTNLAEALNALNT